MGAIACFSGFIGNLTAMVLIVGYILLKEDSEWLKRIAFKALFICIICSVGQGAISLINDIIDIPALFSGGNLRIPFNLDNILSSLINIIKYIILGLMGIKAFKMNDVPIAAIDDAFNCVVAKKEEKEKASSVDLNK